jgi:hypothetical protein
VKQANFIHFDLYSIQIRETGLGQSVFYKKATCERGGGGKHSARCR